MQEMRLLRILMASSILTVSPALAETLQSGESMIRFLIPEVPQSVPPFVMRTPTQYILLDHLTAKLVTTNREGQIVSDLADSWKVQSDFKSFEFLLGENKWSNGELITASDVVTHFRHGMDFGSATHIDFTKIESVVATDAKRLVIKLRESDAGFISKLRCPECGILKFTSGTLDQIDLSVTTGPYIVKRKSPGRYDLEANAHYRWHRPDSVRSLSFTNLNSDLRHNLKDFDADFSFAPKDLDRNGHNHLVREKGFNTFEPKIYFSHFITFNLRSENLKPKGTRQALASDIAACRDAMESPPQFEAATGLAYSDSPASVPADVYRSALKEFNKQKKTDKRELRMISMHSRPFAPEIFQCLTAAGWNVSHTQAQSADEFTSLVRQLDRYDLALNRVDVSSPDIEEHLKVIFNEKFPYLVPLVKDDPVLMALEQMKSIPMGETHRRFPLFKSLTETLVRDGYMAPLFYEKMVFYFRGDRLDLGGLSQTYPDIRFWRVKRLR